MNENMNNTVVGVSIHVFKGSCMYCKLVLGGLHVRYTVMYLIIHKNMAHFFIILEH